MKRKRTAIIFVGLGLLGLLLLLAFRVLESPRQDRKPKLTRTQTENLAQAGVRRPVAGDPGQPDTNAPRGADASLERQRTLILNGRFGTAPIGDVLRELNEVTGGPDVQLIFQALALRKQEALPLVKDRLRTGEMFEKHMLTKFLRLCPWPETKPELVALASETGEQWLPRQGALYALGSLCDVTVGSEVAAILGEAGCPKGVQLVAIATLARIGYKDAENSIRPFLEDRDIHVRLFASRALGELGEPVNRDILFSALQDSEYLVRQEACEALGAVGGADVTGKLQSIAASDPHEAVRDAASQALLQSEIRGHTPTEKLALLKGSLERAERHNALWILQTILAQCGDNGRAFVGSLAAEDGRLRERALAFLILSSNK